MPICVNKLDSDRKEEFCPLPNGWKVEYFTPSEQYLTNKANSLIKQFAKYATGIGLSSKNVCIQRTIPPRIAARVDKRKEYFVVFHKQTHINEIKEAALTAYWILKLRPFMVKDVGPKDSAKYSRINEDFALFYLLSAWCASRPDADVELSEQYIKILRYAFTYWDLSKESLLLISETIGECFS